MITEDYVSFETAKLLKEKGFNEYCRAVRSPSEKLFYSSNDIKNFEDKKTIGGAVAAPTLQMACKWLRKIYKIDVWVEGWNNRYKGYIHSEQRGEEALFYENSYEVACEAAIKYCLENLI